MVVYVGYKKFLDTIVIHAMLWASLNVLFSSRVRMTERMLVWLRGERDIRGESSVLLSLLHPGTFELALTAEAQLFPRQSEIKPRTRTKYSPPYSTQNYRKKRHPTCWTDASIFGHIWNGTVRVLKYFRRVWGTFLTGVKWVMSPTL